MAQKDDTNRTDEDSDLMRDLPEEQLEDVQKTLSDSDSQQQEQDRGTSY